MEETNENIHIGKIIQDKLREQGRSASWLAKQIPCSRNNLYRIFSNPSINTDLLSRISKVLDYNFFKHFN
ncbi:MAG: helix-turn-helix domain-containing protein [Bacteroidales bacterium]|nr:helix-turn-helix domain-containing protein [Bacteroidales bacterium]